MKIKLFTIMLLATMLLATMLVGCRRNDNTGDMTATPTPTTAPSVSPTTDVTNTGDNNTANGNNTAANPDVVTSASIVDTEKAFEAALGKNGTWIICALKDMTFDKDLVLEGDFKNSRDEVQRKIALYTQDDNQKITNRYTLTAPKLTIKSPNASLQHGIFKGDLYVETKDFLLVDTKVEGNIYFTSEEAKNGFTMDEASTVTGKQEVKTTKK